MINLTIELNIYRVDFFALIWTKTADWIIEMHIHSLPVGGAFGTSEI